MVSENYQFPNDDDRPEIGSQLSGLVAAAHAVGLQDHKRMLDMNARNAERSWQMGFDALGWKPEKAQVEPDDIMGGDVNVSGDHQHYHPPPKNGINSLIPWAITAALAGGTASYALLGGTGGDRPSNPDTTERTTIGLSVGE